MGLKQSIAIVNEFSLKTASGGTRGGTPGDYVLRYMARDGATEDLSPVLKRDLDTYMTQYMMREEAVQTLSDIPEIKDAMRDAKGLGGVAFCAGDVSMSHDKVKRKSKQIQKAFDEGKTALKTVISFDTDYLRERGVIAPNFYPQGKGDFRGNVDELKLRMAIQRGMERMAGDSKRFSDLNWIGVIQVDTMHVHCHICAVDEGAGLIMPDGTQKGKITDTSKKRLRRGIDLALDEYSLSRAKAANITFDRQNVKWFVNRFAHKTLEERGLPQFLMSCLPEDTRLWRASTNRKEMRKPNAIVREYVKQVLAEPDSGYAQAMLEVGEYAAIRRREEDLSGAEERALIDQGRERIVSDCMNGVYSVLKQIPPELRGVRTPMLDAMSMDFESMASQVQDDPMVEFGFRLRSYASRLSHHKKERKKYRQNVEEYEEAERAGQASEDARALAEFYRFEEDFNARLVSKYQHFLMFLPSEADYEEEFDEVIEQRAAMADLARMMDDKSIVRMKPENAERYGQQVYGQRGGSLVKDSREILEDRYARMQATLDTKLENMRGRLADDGLLLDKDTLQTEVGVEFDFDDVKALDLHHLGYDWGHDIAVSRRNIANFTAFADERHELYEKAVKYLNDSGQGEYVSDLPGQDVESMKKLADSMRIDPTLRATIPASAGGRSRRSTMKLDVDYGRDMRDAIYRTVDASNPSLGE